MKTKETSTRQSAIAWWNYLKSNIKLYYWRNYQKTTFTPSHSPDELTGREIEEIYDKEVLEPIRQEEWQESQVNRRYLKSNQKQFKQFDESLHKAYLNKFSDEDKFKAFISNLNELSKEVQFNAFLAILRKMKLDSQTESNIMMLVALKDI